MRKTFFLLCYLAVAFAEEDETDGIVPDVVYHISDTKKLEIIYTDPEDGTEVTLKSGDKLTPKLTHNPPHIDWDVGDDGDEYYTLLLVDPDAPNRKDPIYGEWVHWAVSNIPGAEVEKGVARYAYVGAGPPKGTGPHRYAFLLYKQHYGPFEIVDTFDHTAASADKRPKFSAKKHAIHNNLGDPVAMSYFTAEYDPWADKIFDRVADESKPAADSHDEM
jgi:phosphatidylethanolamine-binding protein (PEBP) family uncharacterized protein